MKMHTYGDYGDDSPTVLLIHPMLSLVSLGGVNGW